MPGLLVTLARVDAAAAWGNRRRSPSATSWIAEARREPPVVGGKAPTNPAGQTLPAAQETQTPLGVDQA